MYITFFCKLFSHILKKWKIIKIQKEGKNFLKERSKDLEKHIAQKRKEMKIIPESEQDEMPLILLLLQIIMIMWRVSINSIIHDQLNSLILTFHAFNFIF